ncbi:Multidrug resistance protein MdtO [Chelatococcus asaccharovorans]|nr:Multidrug resistance protein MdtO [Chelatococcus asaccharovorans]CAH1678694.1 Multidrug resistance protein MdtO [Chelatococcus asaccharovorans]
MLGGIIRQVRRDLEPFPGRSGMTWRIALLCALVAAVAMLYKIPEPAIGCYLVIYLMKPNAAVNIALAIGATILVTIVVAVVLVLVQWTIDIPALRLATMALAAFLLVFLGSVSRLGPLGSDMALVVTFALSLTSDVPVGEAATRGLLYAWQMVTMPMALMLVFNLVLGWTPDRLLRSSLRERMETAADALRSDNTLAMRRLLREGNGEQQQMAMLVRLFHYAPAAAGMGLSQAVDSSYRLLLAIAALPQALAPEWRARLAAECQRAAEALSHQAPREADRAVLTEATDPAAREAARAVGALAAPAKTWAPMPQEPFFAADALSNPDHQRFALKTAAAAMACYLIYTGIDWQGIHTAMITCFVAALGTTAETVHKLALRIVGCLIGAAMGIAAILFVIPQITSVGGLMVLVFLGILPAAWVSSGSERISYGGVQIGLAFLLTILQGFEPSIDMDSARDRIIGILLGNVMVYLVFTQIWPVSVTHGVKLRLASAFAALAQLARRAPDETSAAASDASEAESEIAAAANSLALALFEPRRLRPSDAEAERLRMVLAEAEALTPKLFILHASAGKDGDPESGEAGLAAEGPAPEDRALLAQRFARLSHAVVDRPVSDGRPRGQKNDGERLRRDMQPCNTVSEHIDRIEDLLAGLGRDGA